MVNSLLRRERGQSMVIITFALIGLVAIMGLVFDGGNAYLHRRRMQNASDAGAYAGARMLAARAGDNSVAKNCAIRMEIERLGVLNGVPGSVPVNCTNLNPHIHAYYVYSNTVRVGNQEVGSGLLINSNAAGVEVIADTPFNTFFLGVVNQPSGAVNAGATVRAGVFSPATPGVEPIAVPLSYVITSTVEHVILGQGAQDPSGSSSFRGIINLKNRENPPGTQVGCGGGDKHDAVDYINGGGYNNNCGPLRYNDYIDSLTGNSNGNAGVDAYINNPTLYPVGTIIIVAVYPDGSVSNGTNAEIKVIGFAAMEITGYGSNWMKAKFANKYITSGPIDPNPPPLPYLPLAIQLVR